MWLAITCYLKVPVTTLGDLVNINSRYSRWAFPPSSLPSSEILVGQLSTPCRHSISSPVSFTPEVYQIEGRLAGPICGNYLAQSQRHKKTSLRFSYQYILGGEDFPSLRLSAPRSLVPWPLTLHGLSKQGASLTFVACLFDAQPSTFVLLYSRLRFAYTLHKVCANPSSLR